MSGFHGADSEVGPLLSVIVHRPGAELMRISPRLAGQLVFAGLPWADRARQEHDQFTRTLREHGVQVLTVGQYLRPSERHLPVVRYWHPDEFAALETAAYELGFDHVAAGPLVRSSYHADQHVQQAKPGVGPLAASEKVA